MAIVIPKTAGKTTNKATYDLVGLRIAEMFQDVNPFPSDVTQLDYTILGLTTESPKREAGGKKNSNDYTFNSDLVVQKMFEYVEAPSVGVWIKHIWFDYNSLESVTKTEFKPLSIDQYANVRAGQRRYVVQSLDALAIADPALEPYISALRTHYSSEIDTFLKFGTSDWKDAINAETDPTINAILDSEIIFQGVTFTVRDGILLDLNEH